jgi:hypothetical protein
LIESIELLKGKQLDLAEEVVIRTVRGEVETISIEAIKILN